MTGDPYEVPTGLWASETGSRDHRTDTPAARQVVLDTIDAKDAEIASLRSKLDANKHTAGDLSDAMEEIRSLRAELDAAQSENAVFRNTIVEEHTRRVKRSRAMYCWCVVCRAANSAALRTEPAP